jgi:thiol:disulfide interchange protein DsbC
MFKSSSLLTVLFSLGLAAPVPSFASGACANPDFKAQKVSSAKAPTQQKTSVSDTPTSKESKAPSVPLIAGQADELKTAADNFKTRYPKTKVIAYRLTPLAGIFEATVGKEVIYFDKTARFVFSGRLLDMDRGEDLTDKRLKDLRKIAFDSLPLDKAVKTVYGNGKRKLAVFTDVDCPFSRKLGTTLESLKDVTVYTFLFPLESIHPEARGKSEAVWCAKDPSKALSSALKGEPMLNAIADNPV